MRGDLLKHADPDWLDRLRFGAALTLWNILLTTTAVIAVTVVVAVMNLPQQILGAMMAAGGAFGLWASFVITTQEPRIAMQEDPVNWRKTIRTCATIAFVATIVEVVSQGVVAITVTADVLSLTGVVALFGELVYFRRFALRIPNAKLARHTRIVMWGTSIVVGLLVLVGIATVVAAWATTTAGTIAQPGVPTQSKMTITGATITTTGSMGIVFVGASCLFAIPGVVFSIWYVVLLFRYRAEFETAAAESRGQSFTDPHPAEEGHGPAQSDSNDLKHDG